MRYAQRGILHLTGLLTEDGPQQFLFSRQFRLTFRRDLTNQDILRPYLSTHIDDAALIEVTQSLFTNIGNVPRDLLGSQLGIARINLVFLNVYRREVVFTHYTLTDENGVFIVATLPAHKGDQDILSECQFAILCGRTVGNDLSKVDIVTLAHYWSLVDTGTGIRTHKLAQAIGVYLTLFVHNIDLASRSRDNFAIDLADYYLARVDSYLPLNARTADRRLRPQQRHRLTLHVRTHQGAVYVVMFKEWNERSGYTHRLARRYVHVVHVVRALL